MAATTEDITELRYAYQVLGLPTSASPHAIRQAYRRMARLWHPDLFRSATSEHAEATQMMKIINEAFAKVEGAPLRGYVERQVEREEARPKKPWTVIVDSEGFPMGDRWDFWIRFFYGACSGALVGAGLALRFEDLSSMVLVGVAAIGVFGFGAARNGDRFWQNVYPRWWW